MVNYNNVAKTVEPKRRKVAEAEKNLRIAQKDLAQTKQQLVDLNAELARLRKLFEEKTAEQQDLKSKARGVEGDAVCVCVSVVGGRKGSWEP